MIEYEISGITNPHSYAFVVNLIKKMAGRKYNEEKKCYELEKFHDCTLSFSVDRKIDINEAQSSLVSCDKGLAVKVLE